MAQKQGTILPPRNWKIDCQRESECPNQDALSSDQLATETAMPDLILYGGDDVTRFRLPRGNYFEDLARLSPYGICAVSGNDDTPECREIISGHNVHSIHCCPLTVGNFAIIGLEGVSFVPA
jgi:hypothetical protein